MFLLFKPFGPAVIVATFFLMRFLAEVRATPLKCNYCCWLHMGPCCGCVQLQKKEKSVARTEPAFSSAVSCDSIRISPALSHNDEGLNTTRY